MEIRRAVGFRISLHRDITIILMINNKHDDANVAMETFVSAGKSAMYNKYRNSSSTLP